MKLNDPNEEKQEIIIVRRGGGDGEEAHHGGVWKIAFADFMTAMMCFFLVMWLINAANEQTRAAVASYFNPVKLVDRSTNRRGIDDIGRGPQTANTTEKEVEAEIDADTPLGSDRVANSPTNEENAEDTEDGAEKRSDERLFSEPYVVLAEIAEEENDALQNISSKGDGGVQKAGPASGASGGESYRDPFAPDFWTGKMTEERKLEDLSREGSETAAQTSSELERKYAELVEGELSGQDDANATGKATGETGAGTPELPAAMQVGTGEAEGSGSSDQSATDPFAPKLATASAGANANDTSAEADREPDIADESIQQPDIVDGDKEDVSTEEFAQQNRDLAEAMQQQLASVFSDAGQSLDGISVTPTDDGVKISIADELKDGMFEVGSAVPRGELVLAMEKIGKILAEQTGEVTINGHTDGRPFAGEEYDNWRLSTARAHSAYYMLVRGGLGERRVAEVAGFADRKLAVPDDPYANANRRIEILLATR